MQTTTKGLIIKEQTVGESDRLVVALTSEFGLVKAFVRRAKAAKSKSIGATSLLAYSELTLYRGKDAYIIDRAVPIEIFFHLRDNIEVLSLAQYFAQLAGELAGEEEPAGDMLRLILNSFYLLCRGDKNIDLIKAALELRILCLGGYMPNLISCEECGTYLSEKMYFDTDGGSLVCSTCHRPQNAVAVPQGVVEAMRYICLCDIGKVFSFKLSDENIKILSSVCERFLLSCCKCRFTTLEFYKGLK